MTEDRRTTIDGDQITDRTVSEEELDISNPTDIADTKNLGWDSSNSKFKWYHASKIGNIYNIYQASEDLASTTSTNWQNKINLITPSLPIGTYEFWYYIEHQRDGGAIHRVRLVVDSAECCHGCGDPSFVDWISESGFVQLSFNTVTTHSVQVQFASGTSGRQINVRRARLRILSIGLL